jgi:hypothetical protein
LEAVSEGGGRGAIGVAGGGEVRHGVDLEKEVGFSFGMVLEGLLDHFKKDGRGSNRLAGLEGRNSGVDPELHAGGAWVGGGGGFEFLGHGRGEGSYG